MSDKSKTTEHLWEPIEGWLASEALELDDLEWSGRTLRVLVDGPGGVDLDRLAAVSEGISDLLDARVELEDPYQLEVSTPGLERSLRRPRHYEKSVGREVSVKGRGEAGTVVVKGILSGVEPEGITVSDVSGPHHLGFDRVISARTIFRWEKTPKPGGHKPPPDPQPREITT